MVRKDQGNAEHQGKEIGVCPHQKAVQPEFGAYRGLAQDLNYIQKQDHQDPPTPYNGQCLPPEDKVLCQPCAWYRTL